jgi:hypothetical protein
MRYLIYAVVALLLGYGLTLIFYMAGDPFVKPALLLASLLADRGGDTLLPAFLIISAVLCSVPIYFALCWAFKRMHRRTNVQHPK